ncbi:hypothetical protein IQ268_17820 [Oculatella sp. LEGE 06141]|uniref:hypothetical protein n=1 Tax=Oculatella sp. LEGE 06141 TaxID=1828648 RepID=UPI00187F1E22|nr:hypothetical protein [Oculatella sp. LEGE 06141]MBE9180422.1 hypothetical protein [Oculatella sp. LEGE 06141]
MKLISQPLFVALLSLTIAPFTVATASAQTEPVSPAVEADTAEMLMAQTVAPGRSTLSGPSYIGVGGNIGFGGSTALGEGNFTVFSKVGLTPNLSARPAVVIGSDPTILVPITADFAIAPISEGVGLPIAPYIGGGVAISTGSDSLVRPVITGGVDVPLAARITATANANVAFFRDTEVGVIVGVGYNF